MRRINRFLGAALACALWQAGAAAAAELTLGAGAAVLPDYQGADEYRFIPLPYVKFESEWVTIRNNKLGLEADLVPWKAIEAGPIVRYDGGRDGSVEDAVVSLLPDVGDSVEIGGYVGGGLPLSLLGIDSSAILVAKAAFIQGLDGGHEGGVIEGSLGVYAPLTDDFSIIASATASYMSENYAESYFGVSPAAAAASGLAAFDADAGFKDAGASLIATYQITDTVSAAFIGSYSRLIEDAADSPVVAVRGSADQFFAGLGLAYTFK